MDTHQQNQAHAEEMVARAAFWSSLAFFFNVFTVLLGVGFAVAILVFLLQAVR